MQLSGDLPWLTTSGNLIVQESTGTPVLLRGVNRSGLEYSEPDEFGFLPAAGITRRELEHLSRTWNCNILRLPFNQDWALRGRIPLSAGDYLQAIDTVVAWAARNRMYTLLDLQWLNSRLPYGSASYVSPLPDQESVTLWRLLAERYRDEPAALYDIFNEPHDCAADDPRPLIAADGGVIGHRRVTMAEWQPWALLLIDAIRAVHSRSLIFVSGINWAYDLRGMPLPRHNLVYSTHVYANKSPDWDLAFGNLSRSYPVFAAEWGCFPGDERWGERLACYLDELGIGWTAWSWSDKPHLVNAYEPGLYGKIALQHLRKRVF
jgi:hypothetical protein